jgi:TolB-like protein/Tfp pilus assembly protein PilF
MLTGQLPYKGDYEQAIIYSIMNEEPQIPSSISSEITPELELIINKALTKDPDERYQQMDELIEDLKSFSEGATPGVVRIKSKKSKISHPLIYGISALVIILAIFVVPMLFNGKAGSIKTIAVLPLENLTGDPDQEYFCDGMTDALIGELAQIKAIRVISRHSAMKYKNTDKSIKEIAEELNVDVIVDASFLRSGTLIRINANLIDAKEDQHLWAQQFEHEIKDILRLYSEVARTITGEIQIELSPEEEKRLTTTQQVDPEAYDHYLMARFHYNNFQWLKAKEEFEHAIMIDTTYAGAYAGLAYCYVGLVHFGFLERVDVINHAKRAGLKAIGLDSTSVEALVALGSIFNFLDWNFAEAGKHLSKAVDLNPNSAFANDVYGANLITMGRFDEAIKVRRHYRELDPLTIKSNFGLGWAYWYSGQFETAISHFKKTLEIDSTNIYANSFLALSYSHLGMHDKALSIVHDQMLEEKPYPAIDIAAQIYARAGQDSNALKLVDKMADPIHMYDLALIYSILGEKDKAFEWLEKCYQIHHTNLPGLKVEPDFEHIRSDPRYDDLIVRIGFP